MEDIVHERFKSRIADLGLAIDHVDENGLINIKMGDEVYQVSLDNIRKSYERENNFDHLDNLITSIHKDLIETQIPDWETSKEKVYISLFPSGFNYGDIVYELVSNEFIKHYVYYDNDRYIWIEHL